LTSPAHGFGPAQAGFLLPFNVAARAEAQRLHAQKTACFHFRVMRAGLDWLMEGC
jgi:hypothetical protein